jgi:hypothetical protein
MEMERTPASSDTETHRVLCESEENTLRSRFSGSVTTPKVDVAIDMGNPFLNLIVDGFLKIGTVCNILHSLFISFIFLSSLSSSLSG